MFWLFLFVGPVPDSWPLFFSVQNCTIRWVVENVQKILEGDDVEIGIIHFCTQPKIEKESSHVGHTDN